MAEKGILIADQNGGESVACRDAVLPDNDSNSRIIQLIDNAARPVTFQRTTPLRTVTVSDDTLLDPAPSFFGDSLDVSDASGCVVWGTVTVLSTAPADSLVTITPIVLSEDASPVAVCLLEPLMFKIIDPSAVAPGNSAADVTKYLRLSGDNGTDAEYVVPLATFPTLGAKKLAFHVSIVDNGANDPMADGDVTVKLFASPTSWGGRDYVADNAIASDHWSSAAIISSGGGAG